MSDLGDLFKVISEGKKHYEETDPVGKKIKEVKQHAKSDLQKLFDELSSLQKQVNILEETKQEDMMVDDIINEAEIITPEQRITDTNNDVSKYLTGKTFQQPNPDLVSKDIEAIRQKMKFLEQAIGRIAATGPGSGAAEIYNLDMPTKTVTGDYTIGRKDYYIGVDHNVKTYITLPTTGSNVKNGRIVVIKDESGHAQLTPIKIVGTIDNDPNGAEIRINNGAVQLLYSNGQWRII